MIYFSSLKQSKFYRTIYLPLKWCYLGSESTIKGASVNFSPGKVEQSSRVTWCTPHFICVAYKRCLSSDKTTFPLSEFNSQNKFSTTASFNQLACETLFLCNYLCKCIMLWHSLCKLTLTTGHSTTLHPGNSTTTYVIVKSLTARCLVPSHLNVSLWIARGD